MHDDKAVAFMDCIGRMAFMRLTLSVHTCASASFPIVIMIRWISAYSK
jgi:hypothetical protein